MAAMNAIAGIHPVREALRAGRPLDRVHIVRGAAGPRLQEIVDLCRERRIPVRFESRESLDRMVKDLPHQGVIAYGAAHRYAELADFLDRDGLLVILDGVEDPHNLGAVIRSAHAAGAAAVVVAERRSAPLTGTVAKVSAGALSYVPVVRAGNLNRALEELKEHGFWIFGLDERAETTCWEAEFTPRTALVLGAEGHGLHEQVRKHCDFLIRIPMQGAVASLNVSVAAGIVLFEWVRRGRAGAAKGA
jgi:23S rRNA (guanosine2251-2'-O)-methyltransferase